MSKRKNHSLIKRLAIDAAGFGLIIGSILLGWLPGPGGIPMFLAGLGILSLNYDWAENLLKDFEKKRVEFVNKYLMGDKKTARTIDILCVAIMAMAVLGVLLIEITLLRFLSLGAGTLALFLLISNQKRLDRFYAFITSKHKH